MKSPITLYKTKLKFHRIVSKGYAIFFDHNYEKLYLSDVGVENFLEGISYNVFETSEENGKTIFHVLLHKINPYYCPILNKEVIDTFEDKPLGEVILRHPDLLKQDLIGKLNKIEEEE